MSDASRSNETALARREPQRAVLLAVGASLLLPLAFYLWPAQMRSIPFTLALVAVTLIIYAGGVKSAGIAGAWLVLAADLILLVPKGSFWLTDPDDRVHVLFTLFVVFLGVSLAGKMRAEQRRVGRRQAALVESDARYRLLMEQTSDAVAVARPPTRLLVANRRTCEMFGYTEHELLALPITKLFAQGELECTPLRWSELDSQDVVLSERRMRRKDGSSFEAELSVRRTSDGNAHVMVRDITARRQAELAYRAEHDLLQSILETSVAAVIVLDPQGRMVFCNQRAESVLGVKREVLSRQAYDSLTFRSTALDGSELPHDQQPFHHVLERGEAIFDVRLAIEWPEGSRRVLSVNGAPVKDPDGRVRLLVFSIADITEQYRSDEARRLSEAKLRSITEAIPGVVYEWEWHRDGFQGFTYVSERARDFFGGTDPDQLVANPQRLWASVLPEDLTPLQHSIRASYETLETWTQDFRIRRRDGQVRWIRGISVPERFGAGPDVRWRGILMDITERKELERALLQAQKMESIGRLAGGVAHDFNNILTVIRGYAELLREDLPAGDERRNDVEELIHAAERATGLTRQLLALSRQPLLQARDVDVSQLVRELQKLFRRVLGEPVTLVTHLGEDTGVVHADPGQLEQVLLNLVVNARDAMPEGGTLTIETRRLRATFPDDEACLGGLPPGDYVQLRVSDTGLGMDTETLGRIFEPFFTTKEVGKGSGLGLAIVYSIAQQCGGTVVVESLPGHGATLRVLLPRAGDVASTVREVPIPAPSPLPLVRARVLLVEDDDAVRHLTRKLLEESGCEVHEARNGDEALDLAVPGRNLDLLVTDVVMPGMSGPELARKLQEERNGLAVLLLSGFIREEVDFTPPGERQAFLQKPFTREALRATVAELLRPVA